MRRKILVVGLALAATALGSAHAGDVFRGKAIFDRHCAGCHGRTGEGVMPGMPNFAHGDRVMMKTDGVLTESVRQGVGIMPGFSAILKDDDIQDVIAYMRSLL